MTSITIKEVLELCRVALAALPLKHGAHPRAYMETIGITTYSARPKDRDGGMRHAGTEFMRCMTLCLMDGFILQKRLVVKCPDYRWSQLTCNDVNVGNHNDWNFEIDWDKYQLVDGDGASLGTISEMGQALYDSLADLEEPELDLKRPLPRGDIVFNLETGRLIYDPDVDDYVIFDAPESCSLAYAIPCDRAAVAEATIKGKTVSVARSNVSGNVLVSRREEDSSVDESTQLFINGPDMAYAIRDGVKTAVPGKEDLFFEKLMKYDYDVHGWRNDGLVASDKELARLLREAAVKPPATPGKPCGTAPADVGPFEVIRGVSSQLASFYGKVRRAENSGKIGDFTNIDHFTWLIRNLEVNADFCMGMENITRPVLRRLQYLEPFLKEAVLFVRDSVGPELHKAGIEWEQDLAHMRNDIERIISYLRKCEEEA